jgi:hypothetical protein
MRNYLHLFAFLPLMLLLSGCPVDVPYPLGDKGNEKIDKELVGIWSQPDSTMEVLRAEIIALDKYTLQLTVMEKGESYVPEVDVFKGWCTELDGYQFVYFQSLTESSAGYFTYCYKFVDGQLHTFDVSLLVGGIDAIVSTEAYRQEVSASLKMEGALASEQVWTRL